MHQVAITPPVGKRIAIGSWDGTVQVYDPVTGMGGTIFTYATNPGCVYAVAWSFDGKYLGLRVMRGRSPYTRMRAGNLSLPIEVTPLSLLMPSGLPISIGSPPAMGQPYSFGMRSRVIPSSPIVAMFTWLYW